MAADKRKILELARKLAQKNAKDKALAEYQKLLKLDPKDAKLRLEVGDAHRRWGQVDEAIRALEHAPLNSKSREPWVVRLRYAYADALEEAGRRTEALTWFHRTGAIDGAELTDAVGVDEDATSLHMGDEPHDARRARVAGSEHDVIDLADGRAVRGNQREAQDPRNEDRPGSHVRRIPARPTARADGLPLPQPLLRKPVASPLIVRWIPRCTSSFRSPARQRRRSETCRRLSGSRYGKRCVMLRARVGLSASSVS